MKVTVHGLADAAILKRLPISAGSLLSHTKNH
jgi:hypothetical protein